MGYNRKKYEQGQGVTDADNARKEHSAQRPGDYNSRYQGDLDRLREQISGRHFNPDIQGNPLYGHHVHQGKLAMKNAIAESTALTGGYANSWAQSAGQQAFQGYMDQATDEIYQAELQKYLMEGDQLNNQYGMLSQAEQQDYSRYQDLLDSWMRDQDRLDNAYWAERNFDYGQYQDTENAAENAYWKDAEWNHMLEREAIEDQRYAAAQAARRSGGGGGGSGGGGSSGGGDGIPDYASMSVEELSKLMSQARSRQEGKDLADMMYLAGVDEDLTHRLYAKYFERGGGSTHHSKPTSPKPGPNRDMVNLY